MRRALLTIIILTWTGPLLAEPIYYQIDDSPHDYRKRAPRDRFSGFKEELESGRAILDQSSERTFVESLLKTLDVPASSQMLVFSTTSLQLSLISPSNPRALYFTEDLYIGFVPGGRIEIASIDPDLGGIYYIFNIPKSAVPAKVERSERCMNCHASADTQYVPGLVLKSVIPGRNGGSLTAFRQERTGHGVAFHERFGGWYITGQGSLTNHHGNKLGRFASGALLESAIEPGRSYDPARYPIPSSDVLPQLIHEHQVGFVNRFVEASYFLRQVLSESEGKLTAAASALLDERVRILVGYLLFADEAPLPAEGVEGDPAFKRDFLRNRRATAKGISLKDFDLRARLFKYRCSYMIYSAAFKGLPTLIKRRIYHRLSEALREDNALAEFSYLPPSEKRSIRRILKETMNDLPADW